MVHFRKLNGRPLSAHHAKANAAIDVRSTVEHTFAGQEHRIKLFVRTIGTGRADVKIRMAKLAYNFQCWRGSKVEPCPQDPKSPRESRRRSRPG